MIHSLSHRGPAWLSVRFLLSSLGLILLAGSLQAQIYVAELGANRVGTYDLLTGAPVNVNFITGFNQPFALTLQGNTVYVGGYTSGINRTYNATTGAVISSTFFTSPGAGPSDYAFFGTDIYVANNGGGTSVGRYNATTGATVNANFITGLPAADSNIVIFGNNLLVGLDDGTVRQYDASTGALLNANFLSPSVLVTSMTVVGSTLYVTDISNNRVSTYNAITGALINANFITSVTVPWDLAYFDGKLYVVNEGGAGPVDSVRQYDAATGALLNASFITGLNDPYHIAVVPEPATAGLLLGGVALLGLCRRRA